MKNIQTHRIGENTVSAKLTMRRYIQGVREGRQTQHTHKNWANPGTLTHNSTKTSLSILNKLKENRRTLVDN